MSKDRLMRSYSTPPSIAALETNACKTEELKNIETAVLEGFPMEPTSQLRYSGCKKISFDSQEGSSDEVLLRPSTSSSFTVLQDMLQKEMLCDIKITIQNKSFNAHSIILVGTFGYFQKMFADCTEEQKPQNVLINEIDPGAMELLLDFAYGKPLKVTMENVESLLRATSILMVDHIKKKCCRFLVTKLNNKNVLHITNIARSLNCSDLEKNCCRYISENIDAFSQSKDFIRLPFSVLRYVLSKDDIFIKNVENFRKAVFSWMVENKADLEQLEDLEKRHFLMHNEVMERIGYHQIRDREILMARQEKHKLNLWHGIYVIHVICKSKFSTLSVQYHDAGNNTWMTLKENIPVRSSVRYVIGKKDTIYIFDKDYITSLEVPSFLPKYRRVNFGFLSYVPVLHNDDIYIFQNEIPKTCFQSFHNKIIVLHPEEGISNFVDTRTRRTFGFSAVSLGEYIYITGGASVLGCVNVVERYHSETKKWMRIQPMLTARQNHSSATLNENIYVCGGVNDSGWDTNSVEVYSTFSEQWIRVTPMKEGKSSFSLTSGMGKLFLVNNCKDVDTECSFEIYDPKTGEWITGCPLVICEETLKKEVRFTSSHVVAL